MKRPSWVPHPASWACAVALGIYAKGMAVGMAIVAALLFQLLPHAPRLAWMGLLLLWVAPIGVAALLHRATHGLLDFAESTPTDAERRATPLGSLWAGLFAWMTVIFVTLVASFVLLVIDPPPVDPDSLGAFLSFVARGPLGFVHAVVWVALAAYAYELERSVRSS